MAPNRPDESEGSAEEVNLRPELVRILLGLFLALTLASQGKWDPDPMSLAWPTEGISNWFGLPGALFAGFWIRFFGYTSFSLVIFLLFAQSLQTKKTAAVAGLAVHFMGLVILVGLLFPPGHPYLEPTAGLLGLVANDVMSQLAIRLVAVLVLSIYLIKAATLYRFKGSFILFALQGFLGLVGLAELIWSLFLQLKSLSPAKIKEVFGDGAEDSQKAPTLIAGGHKQGALLKRAMAELRKKESQIPPEEESEKK